MSNNNNDEWIHHTLLTSCTLSHVDTFIQNRQNLRWMNLKCLLWYATYVLEHFHCNIWYFNGDSCIQAHLHFDMFQYLIQNISKTTIKPFIHQFRRMNGLDFIPSPYDLLNECESQLVFKLVTRGKPVQYL